MNVLLVQISNKLSPKSRIFDNIELFYKTKEHDGFYKHKHYLEYPTWVLQVSAKLKCDITYKVIDNLSDTRQIHFNKKYSFVMFSVMNSNKDIIEHLIDLNPKTRFILGGYCKVRQSYNIFYCKTLNDIDFIRKYNPGFKYELDKKTEARNYKILHSQTPSIPRIQLSTGCTNKCTYCTIPKILRNNSVDSIWEQVESLKDVFAFYHVYIDDKTFGQSNNISYIPKIHEYIKSFNPDFKGFIIQTSIREYLVNTGFIQLAPYITTIEIGLETYNESILKDYNGTFKSRSIHYNRAFHSACEITKSNKHYLVFNIIIGFPKETIYTYSRTLWFLYRRRKDIYNLNLFPFSDYSKGQTEDENTLKGIHKLALTLFLKLQRKIILK